MIYASKSWFSEHLNMVRLNSYPIWLAHYTEPVGTITKEFIKFGNIHKKEKWVVFLQNMLI